MKLKLRNFYASEVKDRKRIVEYIADILNAGNKDFIPYKANKWDEMLWILDSNNNWSVLFREIPSNIIEIIYRYQCETVKAEESLSAWLCFALDAEIID